RWAARDGRGRRRVLRAARGGGQRASDSRGAAGPRSARRAHQARGTARRRAVVDAHGGGDRRGVPGAPVTPTMSLTILSTDEAPMLEEALAGAVAQEPDEIVVVDNASTDATPELALRAGARLVRLEPRVSYVEAMNASIADSHGDLVAFLQADTFVAPGYLK